VRELRHVGFPTVLLTKCAVRFPASLILAGLLLCSTLFLAWSFLLDNSPAAPPSPAAGQDPRPGNPRASTTVESKREAVRQKTPSAEEYGSTDPRAFLQRLANGSIETERLTDTELRELAHDVGRAFIQTTFLLTDASEQVAALRRLPDLDAIASLLDVKIGDTERHVIETSILPPYQRQLAELVPVAVAEINVMALDQYDRRVYKLSSKDGVEESPFNGDHPRGEYRQSTTFTCLRTPYTITFTFDSGRYSPLNTTLQKIADLKLQMRAEVYNYIDAVPR